MREREGKRNRTATRGCCQREYAGRATGRPGGRRRENLADQNKMRGEGGGGKRRKEGGKAGVRKRARRGQEGVRVEAFRR